MNKFWLVGDKFMNEMHFREPTKRDKSGFLYEDDLQKKRTKGFKGTKELLKCIR